MDVRSPSITDRYLQPHIPAVRNTPTPVQKSGIEIQKWVAGARKSLWVPSIKYGPLSQRRGKLKPHICRTRAIGGVVQIDVMNFQGNYALSQEAGASLESAIKGFSQVVLLSAVSVGYAPLHK